MILSFCPNPSIDCFAWLENLVPGKVNRIQELEQFPGGKGVHVALAISELGGRISLMGNWAGNTGEWIKASCREKEISIKGIELEGENRRCYTFRSQSHSLENTEILEPGPKMSDDKWQELLYVFEKELSDAKLICFSGSWPKDAPRDAYARLIQVAGKYGKKVILDCSGIQLKEALNSEFFGLHINEHEADDVFGSTDIRTIVKKINGSIQLVALTKGDKGLSMAYKGKIYHANVGIKKIESTVGSGDALTAGIAWAMEQNLEPYLVASYAVACGAANCINPKLGMIKKKDVCNLVKDVKYYIEEI